MSRILLISDSGNNDAKHWVSPWLADAPQAFLKDQEFGSQAELESRSIRFGKLLDRLDKPVWIIAHGLGCRVTVAAPTDKRHAIKGALLGCPADPGGYEMDTRPLTGNLPFLSVFIARSNDPWMSLARARQGSHRWGRRLIHVGGGAMKRPTSRFNPWLKRASKSHQQANEPKKRGIERCCRGFSHPSKYPAQPC
jgi:predicted alpha/beta hydrolase family esterase